MTAPLTTPARTRRDTVEADLLLRVLSALLREDAAGLRTRGTGVARPDGEWLRLPQGTGDALLLPVAEDGFQSVARGRPGGPRLFCTIPAPALVEMIGCAGYDFVILDSEHTLVDPQQLENLVRAAEATGVTPFVRVPEADPGAVLRALDAGAMGVVIPHVRRRCDVDDAIRAARYALTAGVP